jgi:anti-anti-sigma factor
LIVHVSVDTPGAIPKADTAPPTRPALPVRWIVRGRVIMGFSCTARRAAEHVVLAVRGDVDLATHERLQTEVEPWLVSGASVVVDCSGVEFLDSMGLRVLVLAWQRSAKDGFSFALAAPSPAVVRVLELAGIANLLPVLHAAPVPDPDPAA